jgi:predicted metal-binding membrane protein
LAAGALAVFLKRDRLVVAARLAGLFVLSWLFLIHLAFEMDTMEGIAARMLGMSVSDRISEFLAPTMAPAAATFADAGVTFALVALMWIVMMGVMKLVWVAVIAAFVLAQKIVPGGVLLARVAGVALMRGGAALIARPFLSV